MLVVVCGVPGVGKSSVARHVASRTDGTLLRTDVVRKDLFEDPAYTDEEARMVYDELLSRAESVVRDGGTAVLDGTFHDRRYREEALATADRLADDVEFLKVDCEPAIARRRIREREGDASDATIEVHDTFRETFDPLAVEHGRIDNSGSLEETRRRVDEVLDTVPSTPPEPAAHQGPAP